jgi:hypothetical protein
MQNKEILPVDLHRQYIDKAFREVQPYFSHQTGLLHVHKDVYEGLPVQAAPTYENFLYALLLFRKKTVESIQQGKGLLSHLLFFQNMDETSDQYGNFPVVLTDFPLCQNWHLPAAICPVITAIRLAFDSILGEELKHRLHACHLALLSCALRTQKKTNITASSAFIIAIEEFLLQPPSKDGSSLATIEAAARTFFDGREWLNPAALGRVLVALSHLQCRKEHFSAPLLECARSMWHASASTYAGPALGVFQFGNVPETTVLDCLTSLFFALPLKNRPWPYLTSLELSLITPPEEPLSRSKEVPTWDERKPYAMWMVHDVAVSACFFVPKVSEGHGFHPIRIVTPLSTVVFHFPCGQLIELSLEETTLKGKVKIDRIKEDDPCLIRAFVERNDSTELFIDERKASTFEPEKGITIASGSTKLLICAHPLVSHCMGHISLGNRPGQILCKQTNESMGYDWKISFDFVRGEIPQELSFSIDIH